MTTTTRALMAEGKQTCFFDFKCINFSSCLSKLAAIDIQHHKLGINITETILFEDDLRLSISKFSD